MSSLPPAAVLGLSPTGLYAIRELGRAEIPVFAVGAALQSGAASRYAFRRILDSDPIGQLARLQSHCGSLPENPVLFPTSDEHVQVLIDNASTLSGRFVFQNSYSDGLGAKILDKDEFYKLCEAQGVAYPKLKMANAEDLSGMRLDMSFPCIIKPSRIHDIKEQMAGEKGWIARNAREFDRICKSLPRDAGTMLVQEVVPGPESEITLFCAYFDRAGNVRQPFTARKLRQYPAGFGSASLVQSVQEDETAEIATQFLSAIGYRGIAAAEFKRDPYTKSLKIIEINIRPSLWFSVSTASGKHVMLAAYHDLADTGVTLPEIPQKDGVRWRYGLKDMASAQFYRKSHDFVLPAPNIDAVGRARNQVSAVYALDDPAPFLYEILHYGKILPGRLLRRRGGNTR